MAKATSSLTLNQADIAFLMNALRNASKPMTIEELVEALKSRS